MIRPYKGIWPKLGERVYVDVSAQVIGDVELGDHASVWMNAVVRGDVNRIRIGPGTNVQDNCVVHVFKAKHPTELADHVTVGHSVTLHGCRDRLLLPDRHGRHRPERRRGRGGVDRRRGRADPRGHGGPAAQPGDGRCRARCGARSRRRSARACAATPRTTSGTRRRTWPRAGASDDPGRHGHAGHPARRDPGLAPHRGGGARRSSRATATARSARPSSRRPSCSRAASAPRPTSSRRRCTRFDDRTASSLTLRPEATAGIVRAVIEHNLINTDPALKRLRDRADVPARAAAEGPLPPVPPARRRGLRLHEPVDRRRGDRAGARATSTPAASPAASWS